MRGRIVSAARDLFYEQGVTATGVDAVAERAGVGKMSLYRHFAGKAELVEAALRSRDSAQLDWLLPDEAGPAKERVLALFDRIARAASRPGFHGCPFVRAAVELPGDHPAHGAVRDHKARLLVRLESAARDLGATDPSRLARQLSMLVDGASAGCVVHGASTPAEDARELADLAMAAASGGGR
ncbi:MAG: transcriptional regulator, TetR family [Pseudonocardiales bacterium]|nr:transcriptional regulator, TetR family [Pseudonocardiales bacterium]